ncbi:MAG: AI-2E family transporter [Flavobacteriaceae bacterium]|nr:MAG: AI-2E family transporter [Flavobacteriaceae bacterium]
MKSNEISTGILKAIGTLLGVSLLLYFLWLIQTVLVYIVIAAVLSLIARPIIKFLRIKLKFPNLLAVIVAISLFSGMIIGLVSLFIPLITQQGRNLSLLNFENLKNDYADIADQVSNHFLNTKFNLLQQFESIDLLSGVKEIPTLLNSVVGTVGSLSIGLFSVLFIAFFLMKDSGLMHNGIITVVSQKNEKRIEKSMNTIKDLLSRYFIGLVFQITILFIIYATTLAIFGVENAIVIAFLCALLNLIPYIGPLIGGVLMLFLTMTSNIGQDFKAVILPTTMYVLMGYVIAQLVDNFFSQPYIFSKSVKSHPLEIFLIIIIGGLLFGVIGMVIAVPSYTAIKVVLKEFFAENKIVKQLTKDL